MFSRINKRSSFVWRLPRCALAILAVASMVSIAHAPPLGEVIITDGASPGFCRDVGRRLSDVINVLHTACLDTSDFTATGYEVASSLLAKVQMENAAFTHRTKLLRRPDSLGEVRDVRVRVAMGDTPGTPYQYLVFVLTQKGLIDDMRFSVERWQYRDLNTQGEQLRDWPLRQRILNFLEIYRTAYNRKDLAFMRQVYSDNALIIVGRVLREQRNVSTVSDMIKTTKWSNQRIAYLRLSREQYLDRLTAIFQNNAFVRVEFDSIRVERHTQYSNIYGVELRQQWYSSTYADTGYVFLMMDFDNAEQPLIRVRCWQPERFDDGTIPSIYDFKIVDNR